MSIVWAFKAGSIRVELEVEQECGYQYDGDDDGETQAALDAGEMVAFTSVVHVYRDGEEIGWDALGGSVYYFGRESEFWTAHRDRDPMNRNCEAMRAAHNGNMTICHYFPSMVREALQMAREAA